VTLGSMPTEAKTGTIVAIAEKKAGLPAKT
jgi:hypothetical protein